MAKKEEDSTVLMKSWIERLKFARDYLMSDNIIEEHRRTLTRAIDAAMIEALQDFERLEYTVNDGRPWKMAEIQLLTEFLNSCPTATDYSLGVENLRTISYRLKRSERHVKEKAVEYGLSTKVDAWFNR